MPVVSKVKIPGSTVPVDIRNEYVAILWLNEGVWEQDNENSVLPYEPYPGMHLIIELYNANNSSVDPTISLTFGNGDQYPLTNIYYIIPDDYIFIDIFGIFDGNSFIFNDLIESSSENTKEGYYAEIDADDDSLLNFYRSSKLIPINTIASDTLSHVAIYAQESVEGWEKL